MNYRLLIEDNVKKNNVSKIKTKTVLSSNLKNILTPEFIFNRFL